MNQSKTKNESGLILDRRENETIQIGDNIVIKILHVGNDSKRVRLRIQAPREMRISDDRLKARQDAAANQGMKPGADVPISTSAA